MSKISDALPGLLFMGLCAIVIVAGFKDYSEDSARRKACVAEHDGQSWAQEELYVVTKNKCKVMKVDKYNEQCYARGYVYVTTCPGTVTWETGGKSSQTLSNDTEVK